MLTMYVGGSAFSVSIALTVFMAGLALGSTIAGRIADRAAGSGRLILVYGWLKLAIALYGLLFPFLMTWSKPLYSFAYHFLLDNYLGYNAASSILSTLLLITPTTMIGAAMPLLCRYVINDLPQAGTLMGRLYGADTFGAALGTFLCGFWLIKKLGVTAALGTAVSINAAIGFFCILYFVPALRLRPDLKKPVVPLPVDISGTLPDAGEEETKRSRLPAHIMPVYIILAASSFCGMSYEVIWTKLIALLVGPTTYSFTIVLFTFITGLALGGILFGWFSDHCRNAFGLLIITQFAAAASVLIASHFLGNTQVFFAKILYQLRHDFFLLETVKTGLLFSMMVVPTIFLGAVLPVAVRVRTRDMSSLGSLVGTLFAISTVGAMLGAFLAGFAFVPFLGKARGISVLIGLQVVSAMLASFWAGHKRPHRVIPTVICTVAIITGCLFLPRWDTVSLSRGKYLRPDLYGDAFENMSLLEGLLQGPKRLENLSTDADIISIDDGIGGLVAVGSAVNSLGTSLMFLSVDGKIVTSTNWDLNMMVTAGHLPMMLHGNAKTALVVGLGSGLTAGEILHYPVKQLDVVEISPEVVKACHHFSTFHNNLLTDPRTRIIVQDARTHLTLTERTYDVIVADPINPWMAGSAHLFTLDHFQRVKNRLNPNGIFVQWFHAYQSDWTVFSMFGRTFRKVFPNSFLVNTAVLGNDYLFIGFADDFQPMFDETVMRNNLKYAQKSTNMRISDPSVIYPLVVTDIPASLFDRGRIHTDAHPYMEYIAPRHAYTGGFDFTDIVVAKRQRSPFLQSRLARFESIDNQLMFADYMASLNVAPFGLVETDRATTVQKARYRQIVESFCRINTIPDFTRLSSFDREICLSVQERQVLKHINYLAAHDADNWSMGAAFFYIAEIHAASNKYRAAISYYQKGLQHLPDQQTALLNLTACYERLQNNDKAVAVLQRLTRIRPRSAKVMTRLAANYLKLGNPEEALAYVQKGLEIDPASRDLLTLKNVLTENQKRHPGTTHQL